MKVLVAEGAHTVRGMISDAVRALGHEVVAVENGIAARDELMLADHPQLAIIAWELRGMSGPELCEIVREVDRPGYTYLIMLTSHASSERVAEGLRAGADDYMTKPFNEVELAGRMVVAERTIALTAELERAYEQMAELALTDELTGLFNRRAILDRLEHEAGRAAREGRPLGIVVMDVDHFKRVNDSFGHTVGDGVLADVADELSSSVRATDIIGRYGGEEFIGVLVGADVDESLIIAERMRRRVSEREFTGVEGATVTISAGVAVFRGGIEGGIMAVVEAADHALYEAKRRGRNQVRIATPEDYARGVATEDADVTDPSHQST